MSSVKPRAKSMKKPVEPKWHVELMRLAKLSCSWKRVSEPEVIAFKNAARRNKSFRNIISWDMAKSGDNVYAVSWVARDPRWSASVS